jgi:uncharacterized repeat protein (TIGR01451 family)
VERAIGNLAAGETQRQGIAFVARSAGQLCHTLEVTADGGHTASARACLNVAQPVLRVEVEKMGPPQAFVGDAVRFVIRVTNTGEGVLTNVQITDIPDASLRPQQGTLGLERVGNAVVWRAGTLGPNETLTREIVCVCETESVAAQNQLEVTADGGVRESAVARIAIQAKPAPRPAAPPPSTSAPPAAAAPGQLDLRVADLGDRPVGEPVSVIIVVRNLSDLPDQQVRLTVMLPEEFASPKVNQELQRVAVSLIKGGLYIGPIAEIRGLEPLPSIRIDATPKKAGRYTVRVRVESARSQPIEAETQIDVLPR